MKSFRRQRRSGNVLVLTVILMIALMALLAAAVDLGYMAVVRAEMQRTADSAAIAAAWKLIEEGAENGTAETEAEAGVYAALNPVAKSSPALASSDIEIGYLQDPSNPDETISFLDPAEYNTVRVRVRRTSLQNGEVPLFFARALGKERFGLGINATAAFLSNVNGFQTPTSGPDQNLDILPITLHEDDWNAMVAEQTPDDWTWDPQSGVLVGTDGEHELSLFPEWNTSSGNCGTVDIGSSNNSTSDIARQVLNGLSPSDLAYYGGKIELDLTDGSVLYLNGDTGISASLQDELNAIVGKPRIVPIYREVANPGDNAEYTIVRWGGIRILSCKLTGAMKYKHVTIQPCKVVTKGGIWNRDGGTRTSDYVYSPVWLIR